MARRLQPSGNMHLRFLTSTQPASLCFLQYRVIGEDGSAYDACVLHSSATHLFTCLRFGFGPAAGG